MKPSRPTKHAVAANPRKLLPVTVEWTDACSWAGWHDEPPPADMLACRVLTRGYLVREDKDRIFIAQSVCATGGLADIIDIPRAWVKRVSKERP